MRRVLDAALAEAARVGVERFSVPRVAERAGVNKTSVYRRWPTKDALVRAALEDSLEHVHQVPDTGALATDLVELAVGVAGFITSRRGTAVLRAVFLDGHRPRVQRLARAMWADAGNLPRAVVGRAVARGELRADADAELLLFTLAGALLHRAFVERASIDDAYLTRLVQLLMEGAARRVRGGERSRYARQLVKE
ncbi:MAG: TetR/AcrR family transcriptional regulator [Myxococcota bacterium]